MAKYKVGQVVETMELGRVEITKVDETGKITEVSKDKDIYIRVEDLANKTLTILNSLQLFIKLVVQFIKSLKLKP